jgi:glucose uptake protein
MGLLYAVVTVLAWGTWLLPSQQIRFHNNHVRTFYITAANLVLTLLVSGVRGLDPLSWAVAGLPFVGGLIWAVSGYLAFEATKVIGMAKAVGVWAPLNIVTGMVWGWLLFGEFEGFGPRIIIGVLGSLAVIIIGILMIVFAKEEQQRRRTGKPWIVGFLGAVGAGVLWGSYFIPIRVSALTLWTASLPMAVGMFVGSTALMLVTQAEPRLSRQRDYTHVLLSGFLWGVGNYGMLLLTGALGTGRGFTISQLGVIVNAALGIFLFKEPPPGTQAATLTFIGVVLATVGGIIFGNLGG